jgi:hypothetical protein
VFQRNERKEIKNKYEASSAISPILFFTPKQLHTNDGQEGMASYSKESDRLVRQGAKSESPLPMTRLYDEGNNSFHVVFARALTLACENRK